MIFIFEIGYFTFASANKMSFEAQEILGRRLGHMRKLTDLFLDMEK